MSRGVRGAFEEAALIKVDEPQLAGRADDEVAEVCVVETDAVLSEPLPQVIHLSPKAILERRRFLGLIEMVTQCLAFDVRVHQIRVAAEQAPAIFHTGDRPWR